MASKNSPQPLIEIRNLRKVYQTPAGDFTAVNGINVDVQKGEFVAVIGKSGSGKSTFINMITGIDRPTSGEIVIGGAPVHSFNEAQMAAWRGRNLGIVFMETRARVCGSGRLSSASVMSRLTRGSVSMSVVCLPNLLTWM